MPSLFIIVIWRRLKMSGQRQNKGMYGNSIDFHGKLKIPKYGCLQMANIFWNIYLQSFPTLFFWLRITWVFYLKCLKPLIVWDVNWAWHMRKMKGCHPTRRKREVRRRGRRRNIKIKMISTRTAVVLTLKRFTPAISKEKRKIGTVNTLHIELVNLWSL